MGKEKYIGIMSGTSLDAVDVVLCEINANSCDLLSSLEYPMPLELKTDILKMINGESRLEKVGEIDHRLGLLFSAAVEALLTRESINISQIKAIGSHGQTLWHAPQGKYPFTMQLGDPNILTVKNRYSCCLRL